MWIWIEFQVAHISDANGVEQRPQKNDRSKQEGAPKESFEVNVRQRWHETAHRGRLRRPKDDGGEQCAEENCRGQVNQ